MKQLTNFKLLKWIFACIIFIAMQTNQLKAQPGVWNGKKCAVVLTYDDALNVHLDNAIPLLDSHNFKGTFYVVADAPSFDKRIPEWRNAANNGHELGNHTLTHPCDGQIEGRSWVLPEKDLSSYTLDRIITEIKVANTLLFAIDGKRERTFAYTCGDKLVDSSFFFNSLKDELVAARDVQPGLQTVDKVDLTKIKCSSINGDSGEYMTNLVDTAIATNTLLVFLFHGVGGEHHLDVSLKAHKALIDYLAAKENEIWVAPLVEVAKFIKEKTVTE